MHVALYNKSQLLSIFRAWNVDQLPPTKKNKVVVAFPMGKFNFSLAEVFVHDQRATDGKVLYKVVMLTDEEVKNKVDTKQTQPAAF